MRATSEHSFFEIEKEVTLLVFFPRAGRRRSSMSRTRALTAGDRELLAMPERGLMVMLVGVAAVPTGLTAFFSWLRAWQARVWLAAGAGPDCTVAWRLIQHVRDDRAR